MPWCFSCSCLPPFSRRRRVGRRRRRRCTRRTLADGRAPAGRTARRSTRGLDTSFFFFLKLGAWLNVDGSCTCSDLCSSLTATQKKKFHAYPLILVLSLLTGDLLCLLWKGSTTCCVRPIHERNHLNYEVLIYRWLMREYVKFIQIQSKDVNLLNNFVQKNHRSSRISPNSGDHRSFRNFGICESAERLLHQVLVFRISTLCMPHDKK
jgi:hypothetical protein